MPFHSTLTARERILLYSEPGCGKSSAVVSIAKLLKLTKTLSAHVYVIDNDKSYGLMIESIPDLPVTLIEVYEFPEYLQALKFLLPKLQPNDWLVCDLLSEAWPSVQEYYTNQVFGTDIGSYFLKVRTNAQQQNEFDGWTDWKVINKLYFDFARPFVYKSPCHVIGCATADPVSRGKGNVSGDDKETLSVFGSVGFKPDGQKRLKHQFNTTIFLHKDLRGNYLMTSVKDRERQLFTAEPISNFALDYLKNHAGWVIE